MLVWSKSKLLALGATAVAGAATLPLMSPALGADVRDQLTPDLIAQHCIANGVGSNVDGVFMLANGTRVNGSVLCAVEDMIAPAEANRHDDDDDHEGGGEHEDDDD